MEKVIKLNSQRTSPLDPFLVSWSHIFLPFWHSANKQFCKTRLKICRNLKRNALPFTRMTPFFASWYLTRTKILSLKTTQKSCATCQKMELFWWPIWLILSSGQNSILCKSGIFFPRSPPGYKSRYIDAKCCSNLFIFIIRKSKSNWALFPLIFFGDGWKTIGRRFPPPPTPGSK